MKVHFYSSCIISLAVYSLLFSACKVDKKRMETKQIVHEWLGKEIQFPSEVPCYVLGKDTASGLCKELFQAEYKVLLYVDSTGCSDCRLRLFEWKQLIEEADSLFQGRLKFLFFFQLKTNSTRGLEFLLRRNRFYYPVFIDTHNSIDKLNHFRQETEYQCFLLDKHNKVLSIGHPLQNVLIWELYKSVIAGEKQTKSMQLTTTEIDKTAYNFGTIKKDSRNKAIFTIRNIGKQPLVLYQVSTSCGCTQVKWEKRPIETGKSTTVHLELTLHEAGYFNKSIEVYGNMESSPIRLKITGTVTE